MALNRHHDGSGEALTPWPEASTGLPEPIFNTPIF
jgi:hypothetical protein